MTFFPIVSRELRVASRRRGTYWLRSGSALGVIIAGTWLFLMMQNESPQIISMTLFCILTGSAVLFALLSGVRSTADCLSEEKREGTLGLLFLTDLRGYDVVLGKLAANSLNAFYAVFAAVPMLAIPLLMGGITPGEFGRMALVALNALFFSLAIGMAVSSFSRSAQKARLLTLLLILGLAALLPAVSTMLAAMGKTARVEWRLFLASPGFSYYFSLDAPYKLYAERYWYSMGVIHGLGWLGLLLASAVAPHSWQDRPPGTRALRWRERWQLWSYGGLVERVAFRCRLLNRNAFLWLAARARLKPATVWAVLGLAACGWVWGLAKFKRDWLTAPLYVLTALFVSLTLRCWFGGEATRQLAEDRKAGTLELLLSTPLTVQDILRGQWLALKRQFLGPVWVLLALCAVFCYATLSDANFNEDRVGWFCGWVAGVIILLADLAALYWVGMWQGLTSKNPSSATRSTLLRIFCLPWVAYAMAMLLVVLSSLGRREPDFTWKFYLGLWLALGLATDIGFGTYSRHKLLTEFRIAAQERFAHRPGFWKRLRNATGPEPAAAPPAIVVPE